MGACRKMTNLNNFEKKEIEAWGGNIMNYDDWHRLYREEEDYEYLEYVDN